MTLKEARKAAGLTQKGMSDRLGIPKRTIGSWEDGQRKCPEWAERLIIEKLEQIAKEKAMKTYAIYLDGEECTAYGRFEADNLEEAFDEAINLMYRNTEESGWKFIREGEKIQMYFDGDWQNYVTVEEAH